MLELFLKGGWVMYPILATSVAAIALILERGIAFALRGRDRAAALAKAEDLVRAGDVRGAEDLLRPERGPSREVALACLAEWSRGVEAMEEAANAAGAREVGNLGRLLPGLGAIAEGAPLLGLLGTVLGMIETFMSIEGAGGDVKVASLAGGIWAALLTTAFGLIVAIPALFALHHFEARVARAAERMRDTAARLVALRKIGRGGAA